MKLNWHEPTSHSKFAAIIILLAIVPVFAFYLGMQYQATVNTYDSLGQTGATFLFDETAPAPDVFVEIVPVEE